MPEMTVRSSTRGLPGLPRGRCGLSAFHASSDSPNKLLAMTIASCDSNQAQIYNQNQQTAWVPYLGDRGIVRLFLTGQQRLRRDGNDTVEDVIAPRARRGRRKLRGLHLLHGS